MHPRLCFVVCTLAVVFLTELTEGHFMYAQAPRDDNFLIALNIRKYYLQAEKITWDYLPEGKNLIDDDMGYKEILVNGPNRIGSMYSKYVYKQYTDETYTQEIPTPSSQGFVGPTLRGEEGEIIRVYFRNMVDIPVTVHPHGVLYDKRNEGARYLDGTSGDNKTDDAVPPTGNVILTWKVTSDFAPSEGDPPCLPYAYHSHLHAEKEVNSGLLGLLLICKKGALNDAGVRSDVDREFVLYVDSLNEGDSALIDENLERCQDPAECKRLHEEEDPDFEESLAKDNINGYMFGNLPDLEMCAGDTAAFYVFSLNAEIHPINIFGQTFMMQHHRSTVVGIWSATFRELTMKAVNPGRWVVQCLNSEHNRNGMKVFMTVNDCGTYTNTEQLSGVVRHYYFSAEVEEWDYAPSGRNIYDDTDLTYPGSHSEKYFSQTYNGQRMIGRKYKKSRFIQYSNSSFATKVNRPEAEKHLGVLGPVIRTEAGDTVKIFLKNRTPNPVSIYLEGTSFEESQSGMWLKKPDAMDGDPLVGNVARSGEETEYTFTIPGSLSPGEEDPPCVGRMYHSVVNFERDVNSGLVGPLVICKPGQIDPGSGIQKHVDREMFLFFSSIDENFSWHIDENINDYINDTVDKTQEDFVESNVMRSINGRAYGNLEGLDVCKGDQVVWHVMSFGNTEGLHGVAFNGNNILVDGTNRDSHVTISGLSFSAAMRAVNVGTWSLSCHNNAHFTTGMKALYRVDACGDTSATYVGSSGIVRRYFIAAVERKWNYCPQTIHPISGENYSDPSSQYYNRVQKDGLFIGSIYTKALYKEFTDRTFENEKPATVETEHLGFLGPIIRAQVGDTIEVVFKNMATQNYSMHVQGLKYNKANEGMVYSDGNGSQEGDSVRPGSTFTYKWEVTESSGPTQNGPNCINFMYHSAVDPVKDTYSGLAGPVVVCKRGVLNSDGKRTDTVEREFALLFQAFDENESWYLNKNILENCPNADTSTEAFMESNMYDSINGYIFNNVPSLVSYVGDNVAWYIMALGQTEDVHTVHFHGQSFVYWTGVSHTGDVIEVFPWTYQTIEMFVTNPGVWQLHCHVGEHSLDGMIATFSILEK